MEESVGQLRRRLGDQLANRHKAKASYLAILKQRATALTSFAEQSGPDSLPYRHLRDRQTQAQQQLERIHSAVRRPISRKLSIDSRLLFASWLGLAIFESPINKFLFDVLMNSAGWISLTASIMISGFILGLAHGAGHNLRQIYSDYRRRIVWRSVVAFFLMILVAMAIVAVLTFARAKIGAQSGSLGELLTGLGEAVGELGIFGTIGVILADTTALTLATMNLAGMVAAMSLAYFACDHDIDYDNAQNQVDQLEFKMAKLHDRYLKDRDATVRSFEPDLIGYAANHNNANAIVTEIKTRLNLPLDQDDRSNLTELDTFAAAQHDSDADAVEIPRQEAVEAPVADMFSYRKPTGAS